MHRMILSLICTLAFSFAGAEPKKVDDFYKESSQLLEKVKKEKGFAKKSAHLKALKKSFEETLSEYKKLNPKEGTKQEENISLFFHDMDFAFDLLNKKKVTVDDCERQKVSALSMDSMGQKASIQHSRSTTEVVKWLDVLCKP